jgi:aspartokinase
VEKVVNSLHGLGYFKAVSFKPQIGMVEVSHPSFVDTPGCVATISGALALRGINLIEITTSEVSITLFVDESSVETTAREVATLSFPQPGEPGNRTGKKT